MEKTEDVAKIAEAATAMDQGSILTFRLTA